ncbi:MAG: Holliday junction resolvase RuvX [Clostridia bacterium]|nr:Holliday junction resolvase RuvX [Clostridia bacterium]
MKKILAVDLGDVRTGLAVSDALGFLANGIGTITEYSRDKLAERIKYIAEEHQVAKIIVGNPINMNGTRGEKSDRAEAFADQLRDLTGLEIVLYDERCTTMVAHTIMNETNTRGKKRKATVDTLSAQIILQNYLDSHK